MHKGKHATYKWIMRVLALERHAYFIIDAVHNTYSNYSIYFCMCLFKAFCSLSNTYFHKEIQHSPLTSNTQNRMYKAFTELTSHACLPLWKVCLQRPLWIQSVQRHELGIQRAPCTWYLSKRKLFHFVQMQFLMFKHVLKDWTAAKAVSGFEVHNTDVGFWTYAQHRSRSCP